MFLWIRLNSELLRYQGVQNFAKNNTENAELASKMLKQQHFLYQRKNLYVPILGRIFSGEPDSVDNHWRLFHLKFFYFSVHRTLSGRVWWMPELARTVQSVFGCFLLWQYTGSQVFMCRDRKCLRGFRYDVQASCRHQAHCLRRSRVWATGGK